MIKLTKLVTTVLAAKTSLIEAKNDKNAVFNLSEI